MNMSNGGSWKKEETLRLREVESRSREDVNQLPEFRISLCDEEVHDDDRDYVDRIFKDYSSATGVFDRVVRGIRCDGGQPPAIPDGTLAVLFDYKIKKTQGKRDPLAANHLLYMSTDKGPMMIPVQQARKFALNILRVMDGVEDEFAKMDKQLALFGEDE